MVFKCACKACAEFVLYLLVGFGVGYFIADMAKRFLDKPQSGMVTYYNNMRGLPYLFR